MTFLVAYEHHTVTACCVSRCVSFWLSCLTSFIRYFLEHIDILTVVEQS